MYHMIPIILVLIGMMVQLLVAGSSYDNISGGFGNANEKNAYVVVPAGVQDNIPRMVSLPHLVLIQFKIAQAMILILLGYPIIQTLI